MAIPELHEGDLIMVRSVVSVYPGGAKVTYKAPKDRMLVLMAVEIASMGETQPVIAERCEGKIERMVAGESEYPEIGAEVGSVTVVDRF